MIEVRIPWICLFVIDPPNRAIMADLLPGGRSLGTVTAQTPGIGIIAFTYDPKQPQKAPQSLPEAHHDVILTDTMPQYTWDIWEKVPPYKSAMKPLYYRLQQLFPTLNLKSVKEKR